MHIRFFLYIYIDVNHNLHYVSSEVNSDKKKTFYVERCQPL